MIFKNKHGEFRSGWMLVLVVLVFIFLQLIAALIFGTGMALIGVDASYDEIQFSPIYNTIAYSLSIGGMLLLFWLVYKRPFRQIGFYSNGWLKHLLLGGLSGIVFITLQVLILLTTGAGRIERVDLNAFSDGLFLSALLLFLFVGFFEEILTRGVMMTALKTTRNIWLIVLIPSAIFGLMHALNDNVTFYSLINLILAGILFSYLFIKTGRLWAPIGLHITWNTFMGNGFGIPVSGISIPSIIKVEFTGPDWFTGGTFGLEGGLLCTIMMIGGLIFIHFFVKQADGFWSIDSDMPMVRGTDR